MNNSNGFTLTLNPPKQSNTQLKQDNTEQDEKKQTSRFNVAIIKQIISVATDDKQIQTLFTEQLANIKKKEKEKKERNSGKQKQYKQSTHKLQQQNKQIDNNELDMDIARLKRAILFVANPNFNKAQHFSQQLTKLINYNGNNIDKLLAKILKDKEKQKKQKVVELLQIRPVMHKHLQQPSKVKKFQDNIKQGADILNKRGEFTQNNQQSKFPNAVQWKRQDCYQENKQYPNNQNLNQVMVVNKPGTGTKKYQNAIQCKNIKGKLKAPEGGARQAQKH